MYRKYIRLKYSKFTQQLSSEPVENIYNIKIIVIHNLFYRFESILVGRREANEKLVKEKHPCKYPSGEYTHILETRVHLARIILVPPRKLASLVRLYRLFRSAYLSREPWLFCLQHLLRRSYLSFFLSFFSSPAASPLSIYLPYSRSLLSPSLSLSNLSISHAPWSSLPRRSRFLSRLVSRPRLWTGSPFSSEYLHGDTRPIDTRLVAVARLALSMHF